VSGFLTLPGGVFSRPGLGPAADLLFFDSSPVRRPKKRRQKKDDPDVRDPFAALRGNPAGGPTQALTYGEFARAFASLGLGFF